VDHREQTAATVEYSLLVRGPSPSFPRGGVWMFGVWYALMYLCLLWAAGLPLWFNLVTLAVFGGAAAYTITRFTRGLSRAFAADNGGIWLGRNSGTARQVRLGWEQIRQLTISSNPRGSMLEILLNSGAPATGRLRQAASLVQMSLPLGIRRSRPELLTVLPDPPRYRVPLADVTPDELRSALSALAPATLAIEILP
jgi:hypothetical protein